MDGDAGRSGYSDDIGLAKGIAWSSQVYISKPLHVIPFRLIMSIGKITWTQGISGGIREMLTSPVMRRCEVCGLEHTLRPKQALWDEGGRRD